MSGIETDAGSLGNGHRFDPADAGREVFAGVLGVDPEFQGPALLPEFVLRNIMKFLGYRLGMQYTHIPENINRRFSMNRAWWDNRKIS